MWRPVSKCMMCGSHDLEINEAEEYYLCRSCGASGGGANFWQTPVEMKLEVIASDAVEHVAEVQNLDITNRGKSIVAKAVAEALKDVFKEAV